MPSVLRSFKVVITNSSIRTYVAFISISCAPPFPPISTHVLHSSLLSLNPPLIQATLGRVVSSYSVCGQNSIITRNLCSASYPWWCNRELDFRSSSCEFDYRSGRYQVTTVSKFVHTHLPLSYGIGLVKGQRLEGNRRSEFWRRTGCASQT